MVVLLAPRRRLAEVMPAPRRGIRRDALVTTTVIAFATAAVALLASGDPVPEDAAADAAARRLGESEAFSDCGSMFCTLKFRRSFTVLVMVSILIVFSICMEQFVLDPLKVIEDENLAPIVDTLFAELTLLGFVGLLMFIVTNLDLLTPISVHFFNEGEAMAEMFEGVHMGLFLIMMIFLASATLLLYYGHKTTRKWHRLNELSVDVQKNDALIVEFAKLQAAGRVPQDMEEAMLFMSLRHRFIKTHMKLPPGGHAIGHGPNADASKRGKGMVSHDFELHDYFAIIQGETTSELIELPVEAWAFLEGILLVFYVVQLMTTPLQFAYVFIAWAYVLCVFQWLLSGHLLGVIEHLKPRHLYRKAEIINEAREVTSGFETEADNGDKGDDGEDSVDDGEDLVNGGRAAVLPLSAGSNGASRGPGVKRKKSNLKSGVDIPHDHPTLHPSYLRRPMVSKDDWGWLRSKLFGRLPNPHETLFVGGSRGPSLMVFIMRVQLMWSAIYTAILLIMQIPDAADALDGKPLHFAAFVVVALLPSLLNFYQIKDILHDYVICTSVEMMKKRETINRVRRRMTTKKAIRCLKLIKLLKRKKPKRGHDPEAEAPKRTAEEVYANPLVYHEKKRELQELFNLFDKSGDGSIDSSEMTELLQMMGVASTKEEIDAVMEELDQPDENGVRDGEVDFHEFFNWMANQEAGDEGEEDVEELVDGIFGMIDEDGSGTITAAEFHDTLKKLGTDLSTEDIESMIREVDEDGDGDLDKEEFTRMIEKYQDAC
jgi:Ca2+-binding EF-hand superfamily protein